MPARRRIDPVEGRRTLIDWVRATESGAEIPRATVRDAVRFSLEEFAERHPGRTCELRVPPFGVAHCLTGPRHTRGTPPNVVECLPAVWLALVTGSRTWAEALADGDVLASGGRADLADYLPLLPGLWSSHE